MPIYRGNPFVQGLSGKLADAVFRQTRHGTVLAHAPRRTEREPTDKQKEARKRFREAILWAKGISGETYDVYIRIAKEKNLNPFNIAVSDYRNPPKVVELDAAAYHGKIGQKLRIKTGTLGQIRQVTVTVEDKGGNKLDHCEATAEDGTGEWWVWTASRAVPSQCVVLRIAVKDNPGHWTELTEEREL